MKLSTEVCENRFAQNRIDSQRTDFDFHFPWKMFFSIYCTWSDACVFPMKLTDPHYVTQYTFSRFFVPRKNGKVSTLFVYILERFHRLLLYS